MNTASMTVENFLLVVAVAVVFSILAAGIVRRFCPLSLMGKLPFVKTDWRCRLLQTLLIMVLTYLFICGLGFLRNTARIHQVLSQEIFGRFSNIPFVTINGLIAAALGWLISHQIEKKLIQEERLETIEEHHRRVFDFSPNGIFVAGLDGRFQTMNPAFCSMLGRNAIELTGTEIAAITPPEDRNLCHDELTNVVQGVKDPAVMEKRFCRKNGEFLWTAMTLTMARNATGKPLFVVGLVEDISAKRAAMEELRKSEDKFRQLVEKALVGVYIIQNGRFVYTNPRFTEITGYSSEELQALPSILETVAESDRPIVSTQIQRRLDGNANSAHYTFCCRRKDNTIITVEVLGVKSEYHGRPALLGTLLDVTSQKLAEANLRKLSARFLNVQDEERRRIARELHDTTAQSLAALTMNLALLERITAQQQPGTQKLIHESRQLAEKSVQEIRTVSYLLHPPELDLIGLTGAIREYAAGFAQRSGIETIVRIAPTLPRLTPACELALFRIVQEALVNILRHSKSPTAQITLNHDQMSTALEIRDWGHGIPPERLQAINQNSGTVGVGFAGMRERLSQLGGTLEIISHPSGTSVRAAIPNSNNNNP